MPQNQSADSYQQHGGRLYHLYLFESTRRFRNLLMAEEAFVQFSRLPEEHAREVYAIINAAREVIRAPSAEDRPCDLQDYRLLRELGLITEESHKIISERNEIAAQEGRGQFYTLETMLIFRKDKTQPDYRDWEYLGKQVKKIEEQLPNHWQLENFETTRRIHLEAVRLMNNELKAHGELLQLLSPQMIKDLQSAGVALKKGRYAGDVIKSQAVAAFRVLSQELGLSSYQIRSMFSARAANAVKDYSRR